MEGKRQLVEGRTIISAGSTIIQKKEKTYSYISYTTMSVKSTSSQRSTIQMTTGPKKVYLKHKLFSGKDPKVGRNLDTLGNQIIPVYFSQALD